jgi:hypothetical protein
MCLLPPTHSIVQKQTKVSLKTLIKQGCTVMNLKPNNNHHNGKHYHATQEGTPSSRQKKKGDRYHFF